MSSDAILIDRIRAGQPEAWQELIARFEGRLLAYVEARLRRRDAAEDVVQETLIGLLTSLPNYDAARPLEGYLFSIAAHKLTDHLRRQGRRPALPLAASTTSGDAYEPASRDRRASSLMQMRSGGTSKPRRWRRQWRRFWIAGGSTASGRKSSAWNCCSSPAGRTKKSRRSLACRSKWSPTKSSTSSIDCIIVSSSNGFPKTCFQNYTLTRSVSEGGCRFPAFTRASLTLRVSNRLHNFENPMFFSDAELEGYVDEALPAERMAAIEEAARGDSDLLARLAAVNAPARCGRPFARRDLATQPADLSDAGTVGKPAAQSVAR